MGLIKVAGIVGVLSTAGGATIDYVLCPTQAEAQQQAGDRQRQIDDFQTSVISQYCPQYTDTGVLEDAYDVCFSGLKPEQKDLLIEEMAGLFRRQE